MKKGKELTKEVKRIITEDNQRYKITYTTLGKGSYQVKITEKYKRCLTCKNEFNIKNLEFRQDDRSPVLFKGKHFCKKCITSVDEILGNLKHIVPAYLKRLRS